MKRTLKIIFISVASLLVVLIAVISIALWIVFTPHKLTPIVQKQAQKFIACQSEIGEVELTFFSTFPNFGLKVNHFALINPAAGVPNDTLIFVEQLVGIIDVETWWKKDQLIIRELLLTRGTINVFTDSLGNSNYDITFPDTTSTTDSEPGSMPELIDFEHLGLKNINLSYIDHPLKMDININNLTAELSGTYTEDAFASRMIVDQGVVTFAYSGNEYFNEVSVEMDMFSEFNFSQWHVNLKELSGTLNSLPFQLNGTVANDTSTKNLIFDLSYQVESSPVDQLLNLVPVMFQSYFEGIDAGGLLTVNGTLIGIFNDSIWPMNNIHLLMEKGTLKYADIPIELHDIAGDITIKTDGMTDELTTMQIDRFDAKTPQSSFQVKGMMNQLFSDIYCNLNTIANLTLDEFNPMLPAEMKIKLKGKAQGQVKSAFTLAQLDKMEIEKMKLSGSVTFSDIDVIYDSLTIVTDRTKIDFALPYPNAASANTKFAFARIASNRLEANMLDGFYAFLNDAKIVMETSDIRDTTRLPDLICTFDIDSLSASMDTISIALAQPMGRASVLPNSNKPDKTDIKLVYNSNRMEANMGKDSAVIMKFSIDSDIVNDNKQEDFFLKWLVKGFIDMEQGNIVMNGFTHPIEIPSIKMDFDYQMLDIKAGTLVIDKSDFQLTGKLTNMLSYSRGDSILRGNLSFTSNSTDVLQLMGLTSGIGYDEEVIEKTETDTTYSGPYMVPKGMDISLSTNIKQATFGADTATNINGNVRVYDGILLLDNINLSTPAASMELTAMYRTPRKNHLYLGLNYHMFEVEIDELLQMIPDIDTLMPMLRSFRGKGEFHLAVETYLDSMYNVKKSTLRGASSITGQDLVLMDGETFSEIAKTLRFSKHAENRIDSMSAEFTIFREEIDIYPFLVVMDKYKAVVGGRHNFDLTFDYHISVVESPLPFRLGVDVKGNIDDLKYSLASPKYAEFYRPASRRVVENRMLELRRMIREALTRQVEE